MNERDAQLSVNELLEYAQKFEQEKDFKSAVSWYEKAAQAGSTEAKQWLDDWYYQDSATTEAHS